MPASLSESALTRAEWQPVLFAPRPTRRALLALEPAWPCRPVRVRVHRNHPFEFVASALAPYLAFARLQGDVVLSDYDDALTFEDMEPVAGAGAFDVELVWLDFTRYRGRSDVAALADWFIERMQALRARSAAPILAMDDAEGDAVAAELCAALRARATAVPGLKICPQSDIRRDLGERYFDPRMARISGSRLGEPAHLETARRLGALWIPAAVAPRLKAVVFDLDNTLWAGVLGEDGPDGVRLEPGHRRLQERAVALADGGLFLGLASKNELTDVQVAFSERAADLPLSLERVSAHAISWGSKAVGLLRIAEQLRISVDAVLFIDDNPGELAAVADALPGIWTLRAGPSPEDTLRALDGHPGLLQWTRDETDRLRAADLAAEAVRGALRQGAEPSDYLASLRVEMHVGRDPRAHMARLHALSNKTNQFNLALRRLSEVDVSARLADPETPVVALWLSDRLSDSGLIGVLFTRRVGRRLVVEELCVSCRALGRGLDDALVTAALAAAIADDEVDEVGFAHATGPRNGPARAWLERFSGQALADAAGEVAVVWDRSARAEALARLPIHIQPRDP